MRAALTALTLAIIGVLVLDTTAIVVGGPSEAVAASKPMATPTPSFRLINWAGQTWEVAPPSQLGPNNDRMSDSAEAAYVDSQNRLHLSMTRVNGGWRSVELSALTPTWSYGTYRFVTTAAIARLARPLDFAMFLIRPSKHLQNEVDLEDSRALLGMHGGLDAQYVVQPYYQPHHLYRYKIKRNQRTVQQSFTWRRSDVKFETRPGQRPTSEPLARFHYHGQSAPDDFGMYLHINLFVHATKHRNRIGKGVKSVILDSFTFTPTH
jgi:hypothetical protein